MEPNIADIMLNLLTVAGGVLALFGIYYVIIALFGFKKPKAAPAAAPQTRFAVLVAARNEEAVIGQLVDSLTAQNYPRELYDVYVAPNNCTDDTAGVAAAHGAKIFEPEGPIHGKGEVLTQFVDGLMAGNTYDAMCVFDADNLVHPDFLQKMNDAAVGGVQAAQGFRDSKNPADSAISTCYSVAYWMLNRFYNGGRQALGLSALINGSGFMVSVDLLRTLGGWHTTTMTEDYEFTAQCLLAGRKVNYVADAVIYDEQPLTFFQSWKQRRRWTTGNVQGMELYLAALAKTAVKKRCWACADLAITYAGPLTNLVSLLLGIATLAVLAWQIIGLHIFTLAQVLLFGLAAVAGAFLVCAIVAAVVVRLNRPDCIDSTGRGVAYFALFILSQMVVSIVSIFRPKKTWDAIAHTRAVDISQMAA